ncbi:hypothetical protein [Pseudogemmobacter sonorensis]|uniref:hypothetical protein n=1 Tax=Pseudogemmobacter sonorensis TaxID=2989681 RepID=UPI0036C183CD
MTRRRPHVSDHAMLRYLERVVGIDVQQHRAAVEAAVGQAVDMGACGLVRGGFRYCIDDYRVTTVRPVSSDPRFPRQAFREAEE